MACNTILDLSYDVLLILVQYLSPSSKVCLALTSHFFYSFICTATKGRLKDITTSQSLHTLSMLRHDFEHARLMRQLVTFIPYSRIKRHLRNKKEDARVGCWCPTYNGPRCWYIDCSFERGWSLNLREEYEDEILAVKKRESVQMTGS